MGGMAINEDVEEQVSFDILLPCPNASPFSYRVEVSGPSRMTALRKLDSTVAYGRDQPTSLDRCGRDS